MFTRGEFTTNNVTYGAIVSHSKISTEVVLVLSGTVISAYKTDITGTYSYNNVKAKELGRAIAAGIKGCTSRNGNPAPFELGAMTVHEFIKAKVDYIIHLYRGELVGAYIQSDKIRVELSYCKDNLIPNDIPYVKLTDPNKEFTVSEDELDAVPVRSVEEIALEKDDITWLQSRHYYIVNDDETAEQLFTFFENYDGPISYDTETTGLKINCFSKVGSKYASDLAEYNKQHPDEQVRSDKLVGIIFCVEPCVSYYFPCGNRKFKNLYEDKESPVRKKIIQNIRARYTVGDLRDWDADMSGYIASTSDEDLRLDVILMERVRDILTKKYLVAHNGTFEWKVGWMFAIDTNISDDTFIMHKIMHKFRTTTSNRGEPSDLKYLSKTELGIDQWELKDFFPNLKDDKTGKVKGDSKGKNGKSGSRIDFSYMDYNGTRIYAPADGDCTLELFHIYKKQLTTEFKDLQYIYSVELIVSLAIGYMEFYGHRIEEDKIEGARINTIANLAEMESEIRQKVGYADQAELDAYKVLKDARDDKSKELSHEELMQLCDNLHKAIGANTEKQINLSSPAQVGVLFYDVLGYPLQGDKKSVAKGAIKALTKETDDDGNLKYPVASMYSAYKNEETLLQKFFGNLQDFMYPGGFVFSSFGAIAAATGRMACSKPNCQQYPKSITKIVSPREGYIMLDADYSQIEYRVLTALAKNDELAELFSDPDSDYHTLMASKMFDVPYSSVTKSMRSQAKSFNFGIPYGMGFKSLALLLHGNKKAESVEDAKAKYELYFKNQPRTRQFFEDVKEMAQVNKYTKTLFNRYRYYNFTDKDGTVNQARKGAALRQAGNAVIQGCLHGDTIISTEEYGDVKIKDVVGRHLHVWNGDNWTWGDVLYSGKKQKCIVTFTNGQRFICSPIHRFKVVYDTVNSLEEVNPEWEADTKNDGPAGGLFVRCKHLKKGTVIEINKDTSKHCINDFESARFIEKDCIAACDDSRCNSTYKRTLECIEVESVEITDDYTDMYDVCNTECGYYCADGIVTHNTAADIFKIGVARNFNYIRENKLFGKLLIINMIHDEQLMEINISDLNVQRILTDVCKNMSFHLDNFPPLFVGAGLGKAWGEAKGEMAEIHPTLLAQLTKESEQIPIRRQPGERVYSVDELLTYFNKRIYEFRRKKVYDYLNNPANYNQTIHPAVGKLINMQFNYGRGDDAKKYVGPNGEHYTDEEFLEMNIGDFLKENNIAADPSWFKANETTSQQKEEEEEKESEGYDDNEEDIEGVDDIEITDDDVKGTFKEISESDKIFGSTVQDIIGQFGACLMPQQRICGVDVRGFNFSKIDKLADYLSKFECENQNGDTGLQIVFLKDANILYNTGVYINNPDSDDFYSTCKKIAGRAWNG